MYVIEWRKIEAAVGINNVAALLRLNSTALPDKDAVYLHRRAFTKLKPNPSTAAESKSS